MGYIATISFYEGDTLHEAGQPFEHADEAYIAKLLDDGNIVDESVAAEAPSADPQPAQDPVAPDPLVQPVVPQAPVVQEPAQPQPTATDIQNDLDVLEPPQAPGSTNIQVNRND